MNIVRVFTVSLAFSIFGFGSLILSFLLFPFCNLFLKKENRRGAMIAIIHKSWYLFVKILNFLRVASVEFLNTDFEKLKGKIIVANHLTLIDIVLLIGTIPNCVSVVKSKLASNFFVKNIVSNAYLINDTDIDEFQSDAKEILNKGFNIVIFPSGTRHINGEVPKIHSGAAALALENNVEIVPFKIDISEDFLVKNKPIQSSVANKKVLFKITQKDLINPSKILDENAGNITITRRAISKIIKKECF